MPRRLSASLLVLCLLPLPASAQSLRAAASARTPPALAQQSEQRQATERKAGFCFWTGISVTAAGVLPLIGGVKSVGIPMVAGGGALTAYGLHLHRKAKRMPTTTFGVVPLKKGVAIGVSRRW